MDQLKRDFSMVYVCENCSVSTPPPTHCGKAMQIEGNDGILSWVCWKGEHPPCCGMESQFVFESCCDNPNLVTHLHHILS
ncbi:MAG: hypothetical protein ACW99A_11295 [Candidatus Kariarchaeaceae archaeon]|jgi:hypothetical protein